MKKLILLIILILNISTITSQTSYTSYDVGRRYFHRIEKDSIEKESVLTLNEQDRYLIITGIDVECNSAGGLEPSIAFINNSNKKIKYIYLNVSFKNSVNDVINCSITDYSKFALKITGPIKSQETKVVSWGAICYNFSGKEMIINDIDIIYMDDSQVTLKQEYCQTFGKYKKGDNVKSIISKNSGRVIRKTLMRIKDNNYIVWYFIHDVPRLETCYEKELEYVE